MGRPISFDKEKVTLNLARLKKSGETFEIVINSDMAVKYKEGDDVDIKDVLEGEKIFADAKKGLLASEKKVLDVFGTDDVLKVAKEILENGEVQLNAAYRDKLKEEKRKRIINLIQVNGIDPRSKLPHPQSRIENAFAEGKIRIDDFRKAEDQVSEIIKKLMPILPIKFEKKTIEIIIPAQYAGKTYSVIANFAKIARQDWLGDGSWKGVVEVPAGLVNDLFDALNNITHGDMTTKTIEK